MVTNDDELVTRLRRGDEQAFAALIDRYHASMLRVACRFVSDTAVAEDVVQETWIGVLRGIDRFAGRSTLKTWLFTILLNQARRRGSLESRSVPFSALGERDAQPSVEPDRFFPPGDEYAGHWMAELTDWTQSAEDSVLAGEIRALIQRTIDCLPPIQGIVITLRDLEGWSAAEVCQALSISETNQRVRLHRARTIVRREIECYFEGSESVG